VEIQAVVPAGLSVTPQDAGNAALKHGELVQGTVQEVKEDGAVVVMIKGRLIEATTEIPLNAGDKLAFVVDVKEDKIFLRLATPEVLNDLTRQNIARTLAAVGIPVKPETVDMGINLLQNHLPVNAANMAEMDRLTRALGGASPANMAVAALAIDKGITDLQQVKALFTFFQTADLSRPAEALHQSVQAFKQEINQLLPPLTDTARPTAPPQPVVNFSPPLPDGPETAKPPADMRGGAVPSSPVDLPPTALSRGGVFPDAAWPARGAGPADPAIPAGTPALQHAAVREGLEAVRMLLPANADLPLTREQAVVVGQRLGDVMEALMKTIMVESDQPPDTLKAVLQDRSSFPAEVSQNLQTAREILQNQELTSHFPALKTLLTHLNNWEQDWTAQRLHNALNTQPQQTLGSEPLYFALPVMVNEKQYLCELRFQKRNQSGGEGTAENQMTVAVGLHTAHMGEVVFYVDWKRDAHLTLQGVVGRQEVKDFLEPTMGGLLQELREAGQEAQYLGMKVSAAVPPVKPVIRPQLAAFKPSGIDIRV
jgi:hypothetical protein